MRHLGDPVKSISEYISAVEKTIKYAKSSDSVVVFRGESKVYDTPCQPTIFRTQLSKSDKFFEKNLFEEMSANHLTNGKTYLEIAIDAQHGGFPSRLLDVTYNCLAALYFAVTPYYTKEENSGDNEDGMVYVFFLENLYCPTGNNINEAYVVNMLNHTADSAAPSPSFENFHCDADKVKSAEDRVAKLVLQYADLAAQFAKKYLNTADPERNTLNSNDFKTQTFYEKWCAHAKEDTDVLAWNAAMKAALDLDDGNEYEAL